LRDQKAVALKERFGVTLERAAVHAAARQRVKRLNDDRLANRQPFARPGVLRADTAQILLRAYPPKDL
jgi:Arc/MetJ family transcription regulator